MAKVRETPVDGSDTPPAEEVKKDPEVTREARPKASGRGKFYILTTSEFPDPSEMGCASEDTIYEDIQAFAKDQGIKEDRVHVYELGKKKVVNIEISIKDA